MAYDWTTADVAATDNIQDSNIWNQHLAAIQERAATYDPNLTVGAGAAGLGALSTVSAGTNIQTCLWWSAKRSAGTPPETPDYMGMQAALLYILESFVDTTTVIEGHARSTDNFKWYFPTIRAAAGLPICFQRPPTIDADGSTYGYSAPNLATLPANSSWRRKRPREVNPNGPYREDYDLQGNPAVIGQHAWHFNPDLSFLTIYVCADTTTAPATWVRSTPSPAGPTVDVVDNAQDLPSTITTDSWDFLLYGSYALSATPHASMVAHGDYLGHWLFTEVRAITNLLRWQYAQASDYTFRRYSGNGYSRVSYADAIATMTWLPTNEGGAGYAENYVVAIYDETSGPNWSVLARHTDFTPTFHVNPATAAKIADLYLYAENAGAARYALGYGIGNDVFNDQGDGFVRDSQCHLINSQGPTAATDILFPRIGNALTIPPNFPPDPATYGDSSLGYYVPDFFSILRYDVAGGFHYVY